MSILRMRTVLCFYNRNYGPITFKESNIRYYTDQIRIPDTDFTLFFAAGISSILFSIQCAIYKT